MTIATMTRQTERKIEYPITVKKVIRDRLKEETKKIKTEKTEWEKRRREALRNSTKTIGKDPADQDSMPSQNLAFYKKQIEGCKKRLKKISLSYLRLAGGRYGICKGCDEDISMERLHAVPYADLCTKCKDKKNNKRQLH